MTGPLTDEEKTFYQKRIREKKEAAIAREAAKQTEIVKEKINEFTELHGEPKKKGEHGKTRKKKFNKRIVRSVENWDRILGKIEEEEEEKDGYNTN